MIILCVCTTHDESCYTTTAQDSVSGSENPAITIQHLRAWDTCNMLLDSLASLYQDSFSTDNPQLLIRRRQSFTSFQDSICIRCGLPDGYEQYVWILNQIGSPRYKHILDSLELPTY
ncbi:MAG: hypothetical protein ACOC4C_00200 [Fibrobacterota bacterium]